VPRAGWQPLLDLLFHKGANIEPSRPGLEDVASPFGIPDYSQKSSEGDVLGANSLGGRAALAVTATS
jgi:hypothetical protein